MNAPPPWPTGFAIDSRKITQYLLNLQHPDGSAKARFFLGHGFRASEPDELGEALLTHTDQVHRTLNAPYGVKYVFEGPFPTPNGTTPLVRTVWQQAIGATEAFFVTAIPISKA